MVHKFGEFIVEGVLGRGGMGTVFQVLHKGETRALKQLPLSVCKDNPVALAHARAEAWTMDRFVKHPNIVQIYSTFEDSAFDVDDQGEVHQDNSERCIYVEMECCGGGNLRNIIESRKAKRKYFDEAQIMQWFTDIALAVKYLHDDGIIHRDIKSRDIFFSANGTIKLGAFGLALHKNGHNIDIAGTVTHMPPEALGGNAGPPEFKEDIWALGVMLFEMATLEVPFPGNTPEEVFSKIINCQCSPVPEGRYTPDLRRLAVKLLSVDLSKRPTAEEVIHDEYVFLFCEIKCQSPKTKPSGVRNRRKKLEPASTSDGPKTLPDNDDKKAAASAASQLSDLDSVSFPLLVFIFLMVLTMISCLVVLYAVSYKR